MKARFLRWWQRWGWAALLIACFLVFIDSGLNEPDEGRYAEIGREMAVVDHDWFTPHQNGFQHYQKPPLLYWATASSLKVFGVRIWAARLPSVFAALGTLALTAWLARMLLGPETRRAAALILASSVGFFCLARLLTPDMMLTFWITAAIACGVKRYRGGARWWGFAFFVCMGLGFLTKGPMALVVPLFATLGMRWATPKPERPSLPWFTGMLLTLGIGLSWFVGQSITHHKLFEYFAGDELIKRVSSGKHGRSQPWWFFFLVLPIAFLPWSAWIPSLLHSVWRGWRRKIAPSPLVGLLLGWVLPPFAILSLSGSKLPTYILPLVPALTLAVVAWCRAHHQRTAMLYRMAAGMLAVLVIVASLRDKADPWLRQQAGTNELAGIARAQPDFATATIFAARVRAQGFAFCTGRLLCITKDESDLVMKLNEEQRERVFRDATALEEEMSNRPAAYGIVSSEDVPKVFPPERWKQLGVSGGFILLGKNTQPATSSPSPARAP